MRPTQIILLFLFLTFSSCSWNIYPFIRNLTNYPVRLKIVSMNDVGELDNINMYSNDSIVAMEHGTKIAFPDTLKVTITDPSTATVEIPPRSTSKAQLPYGWLDGKYIVTAERSNGRIDTLNRTLKYKVVRKDGKDAQYVRAFSGDWIYYDLE